MTKIVWIIASDKKKWDFWSSVQLNGIFIGELNGRASAVIQRPYLVSERARIFPSLCRIKVVCEITSWSLPRGERDTGMHSTRCVRNLYVPRVRSIEAELTWQLTVSRQRALEKSESEKQRGTKCVMLYANY